MGPRIPLFWTSGDICPGFQSQVGSLLCAFSLCVILRFTSVAILADCIEVSMADEPFWSMYLCFFLFVTKVLENKSQLGWKRLSVQNWGLIRLNYVVDDNGNQMFVQMRFTCRVYMLRRTLWFCTYVCINFKTFCKSFLLLLFVNKCI